jgi:dihydrofolate synthase/folylpolyglutamate synthase
VGPSPPNSTPSADSKASFSSSAPIRNLADAAAYLEGLINLERVPDFSRERLNLTAIQRLLERLDHPERGLCVLHIAGSKGKGSTSLFAESILQAAGERVGTFTSPHLESWTERFRIGGGEVAGGDLARVVEQMRPAVDALRRESKGAPSFFDATTAAGLLLFRDAKVDRAILEVGLGGRLDSTNAVQSAVTCITSIELEHTDKLGDTLGEIAGEKAGIMKPGVPCVAGLLPAEAMAVVRERARLLDAPLFELGRDFDVRTDGKIAGERGPLPLVNLHFEASDGFEARGQTNAMGEHQLANAAIAIQGVRLLRRVGSARSPQETDASTAAAVARGLCNARLPGRIEVVEREPWVIIDSAHTAASARALARVIEGCPARQRHLVLSISAGKDLSAILDALLLGTARVTITRAEPNRSLPADVLASEVRSRAPDTDVFVVADPVRAVCSARDALARDDLLCVAGSVYLAGIARGVLRTHDVRGAGS